MMERDCCWRTIAQRYCLQLPPGFQGGGQSVTQIFKGRVPMGQLALVCLHASRLTAFSWPRLYFGTCAPTSTVSQNPRGRSWRNCAGLHLLGEPFSAQTSLRVFTAWSAVLRPSHSFRWPAAHLPVRIAGAFKPAYLALMTLTLALTHRLGTKLFSPWHGTLAVCHFGLVSPALSSPGQRHPLADGYCPLHGAGTCVWCRAPPFLVHTLTADRRQNDQDDHHHHALRFASRFTLHASHHFFSIGLLRSLAALSHVYGAFLVPPALLLAAFCRLLGWPAGQASYRHPRFRPGFDPWFILLLPVGATFWDRIAATPDRFGLLDGRFTSSTCCNEVERYDQFERVKAIF